MNPKLIADRFKTSEESFLNNLEPLMAGIDDLIDLSIGDPDFTIPREIMEPAFQDAFNGHTHYTQQKGQPELINEIVKYYKRELGLTITPDEVFVTTSGLYAAYLTCLSVLNPGDEVLVSDPGFLCYFDQIELCGGVAVSVPTYEDDGWRLRPENIEKCITEKTKAIFINTPNNPTGACLTRKDLEDIAAICKKHDILVFADDIYTWLSFQHDFVPMLSVPGMKERTITINSMSKNYVATGARLGWVVAPAEVTDNMRKINNSIVYSAPTVSQRMAIYALRDGKEIMAPIMAAFKDRLYSAAEKINTIPNHSVPFPPGGTFYLFMNIKKTGLSSNEYVLKVLRDAHVMLGPGSSFGGCGEGYVRICCTQSKEKILEALDRIEKLKL